MGCVSTKIQLCVLGALKLELARLNEDQGKFKDYRSWFGQLGCLRVVLEQSRTMINNSRDLWENNEMLDSLSLSQQKCRVPVSCSGLSQGYANIRAALLFVDQHSQYAQTLDRPDLSAGSESALASLKWRQLTPKCIRRALQQNWACVLIRWIHGIRFDSHIRKNTFKRKTLSSRPELIPHSAVHSFLLGWFVSTDSLFPMWWLIGQH